MLKTLLGLMVLAAISIPNAFAAGSGSTTTTEQYICQGTPAIDPTDIQNTLNSMGCDSTKPFTVNYVGGAAQALVCCVSQ